MKRNSVYLLVALVLFSLPVQSIAMEHPTKVSFGYQGLMAGTYLNALSVRGWVTDSFGVEVNGYCGKMKVEFLSEGGGTTRTDLTAVGFRGFYNLVKRENSVFYTGLEYTGGSVDVDAHRDLLDDRIAMYGVFVGSEFRFTEMPELGFNFDIGYRRADYGDDNVDILIDGISATFTSTTILTDVSGHPRFRMMR